MSAGRGQKALNINLPDALAAQLAVLAAGPDHPTKSGVMEAALRAYLEGSAQQTVLAQVHRRLDPHTQAVKALTQHLAWKPLLVLVLLLGRCSGGRAPDPGQCWCRPDDFHHSGTTAVCLVSL